nr:CDGSH iron-sulfur domain-containing protein [Streptomyces sp. YIM 130001]
MLVEGPVEFCLPDGGTVVSDRFMVAVCTCRHSATYPWCDTTHRHLRRPGTTRIGAQESPVEENGTEAN